MRVYVPRGDDQRALRTFEMSVQDSTRPLRNRTVEYSMRTDSLGKAAAWGEWASMNVEPERI